MRTEAMNQKIMPDLNIKELASFYILNFCSGQDLVAFACKALENDPKSETLVVLAGEIQPVMSVVGPLFERVLNELSITKPTKLDAQLDVAHYYARAIKTGALTPYEGACKIWWKVSNEIEHPSELLLSFVGAASEIEDLPERYKNETYDPTPNIEEYKKQIVEAANRLLMISNPAELIRSK
jgi:hypothetical protein